METLKKSSLFWDTEDVDPQKNERFVIERILAYGDETDFKWAVTFYGKEKLKNNFLKIKTLDKKSLSFWCQYFKINPSLCIQNQLVSRQSAFWKR